MLSYSILILYIRLILPSFRAPKQHKNRESRFSFSVFDKLLSPPLIATPCEWRSCKIRYLYFQLNKFNKLKSNLDEINKHSSPAPVCLNPGV